MCIHVNLWTDFKGNDDNDHYDVDDMYSKAGWDDLKELIAICFPIQLDSQKSKVS